MDGTAGPTMTTQTWPAGTFLSNFPQGDRVCTYHRNYFMITGQEGTGIYDISNPTDPIQLQFDEAANNGHRWWKMGDLFYREYSVPEVEGTGYKYLDLSDMLDRKPITSSDVLFTVEEGQSHFDNLETFPHTIDGNRVYDMRTGEFMSEISQAVTLPDIVVRMGNYVFYAPQSGEITVFDFGDPTDIKFLGSFGGDIPHEQYSTGFQVWRNYLIYMSGNEGDNNLVAFDISDPTNVTHGFDISSDDITLGRYMSFQDEYGFTGRFDRGVKYNFEKMEVAQEFFPPSNDESLQFLDNEWLPIGHILVASGDGKTSIFSHQDELDTRPPTVGHHFPVSGATNQPIGTTIGFVINEILDDLSITDQTVQVRPLGGDPIVGDVTSTSYQVINYAPREPLLPNTTYEVKFVEGGIKDATGNGMEEYIFYFTTGGDDTNQSPEVAGIDINVPSPVLINTAVEFTANATDPEGNTLSYRWDFGDGSPKTDWIANTTSYTFDQPGNFLVQVQVSDNNGGFVVASQSIVVVTAIPDDLPTQSSPITVDTTNRIVWSVNPDNNTVTLLNADTFTVIDEVAVGDNPSSVAIDTDGKAWITCRDSDELYVLNTDGSVDTTIPLSRGARPYGVVFTPNGSRGFISAYGSGELLEVSSTTQNVQRSIQIGATPRALAITGDGNTLLVTRFISPDEAGQVWEIDLTDFTIAGTIELPLDDFTLDNGNEGRGLPNYVAGITIHPDNKSAWSVAKKDNIVRGLARDGQPLTFDNSVRTAISPINLTNGTEELGKRLDIDNHGQPSSALYTPTGNYLIVTMQGNNRIVVIDPATGLELLKKDVGRAPQGVAIDTQTNHVFVKNFMDRSVSVFDANDMITSGTSTLDNLNTVTTVSSEILSPTVLNGKQIFYNAADIKMGSDGYVSCATCHSDGTQDGRTWDFTDRDEGLRNTISLIGRAGTAHGRVHWSANFDEIQDFENDIRSHFQGGGFMSDANFNEGTTALTLGDSKAGKSIELDALTAYIESLNSFDPSPYRNNDGSLTAPAIAGKAVYERLECASCHGGVNFTDSNIGRLHDVGTMDVTSGNRLGKQLLGIDVPTLRDVWATAPYLHNGAAASIKDVLTTYNANDAHGTTSTLSALELEQLEAYIKQIDGSEPAAAQTMVLEMSSPVNGAMIERADPTTLAVDTNIDGVTKIAYYVDNELVEEVSTPPFETTWSPIIWKTYTIVAKVFYNNGNTASVTPEIEVSYKNEIKVMFVVDDDEALTSEDQLIKSRLEQELGFMITLFADEDAERPEDANPYDLVLISSSVDPGVLGNDLESAVVPIMTWDPFMYEKLRLTTGSITTDFGFTSEAYASATITNPEHPMAAGLDMNAVLYGITQPLPFGTPSEDAIVIATAGDDPILYGYEPSGTMPSRRVAFPLRDRFAHLLTDDGWKLFDAAVLWTLHGGDADTPVNPLADIFFTLPVDGALVNTPLKVNFETEGWSLPSSQYKLRFRIDGQDRGFISSEGEFIDGSPLSEGAHELTLEMERSNNSLTELEDTITIIVTNDPLPENPTAIINSPIDGGLVGPDFEVDFTTYLWDISLGGNHVRYFIDGLEIGAVYNTAPISIEGLEDGEHTIELVLADASGTLTDYSSAITVTVDPAFDNLPDTDFSLEYRNNSQDVNAAELKPVFQIVSEADEAVLYSDFTIRYWYTSEHDVDMSFSTDYSAVSGVTGTFGTDGEEQYAELGFSASSGSLMANSKSGEIQTRMNHLSFQSQDQSNDFSFDSTKTSLKPHVLVTLYYQGELVWGLEPSGNPIDGNTRPTAVLNTNISGGNVPLSINYDASLSTDADGDTLMYFWDFGNGDTATGVSAFYEYATIGLYTVTLTVDDGNGGIDSETTTIEVFELPIDFNASFVTNQVSGSTPLTVDFDSSSSVFPDASAISYIWDFGDGTTSSLANPSHTYTEIGSYAVILTISDGILSDISEVVTITVIDDITLPPPTALINTSASSGIVPLAVQFDASGSFDINDTPLSFTWNFGDGTSASGVSVNHIFEVIGVYEVVLTASNGESIGTDTVSITVENTPEVSVTAIMSADITSGIAPVTINFDASDSSSSDNSILTYSWDFGDSTIANGSAVSHLYADAGEYTVTLTVSHVDGVTDTVTQLISITDDSVPVTNCGFGTPMDTPLSTIANASYDHIHVLGTGGPDFSNVTNCTINWDLQNNGLWQFSMNTNNGIPGWWNDIKSTITDQSFNSSQPEVTFAGTGFVNMDGSYYVANDGANFALVATDGSFTVYFSNDATPPSCLDNIKAPVSEKVSDIFMFPIPVIDKLTIESNRDLNGAILRLIDVSGKVLSAQINNSESNKIEFNMAAYPSGIYFIEIKNENESIVKQLSK
ncbi:hypothetical protein GCM10022393_40900 [Aquimarina addita]|uniref:PKD domain-containing protein n=2 Tax=Aquimarina addita TaxID=870485 RepID=A0ABP6UTN0_9FLAO